jgi:hypothetical protein
MIALFLKGDWNFKKSWTSGLQYTLLHHAKSTATWGHWYQLHCKRFYYIECVEKGMSQDEMIIQARSFARV